MSNRTDARLEVTLKALSAAAVTLAVALTILAGYTNASLLVQTGWQTAAGGRMTFEVASVKPSTPEAFKPPE